MITALNPWLAFYVCIVGFVVACLWTLISFPLAVLIGRMFADRRTAEQQTAADHDEPTREQVEWELQIAEAIRLTKEDAAADRTWDELEFAASVMADIDQLPGGAA